MCGFVGQIYFDGRPVNPSAIDHMTNVLRHRGPDDSGRFIEGSVGLGFRRLSILDLAPTGHQPMTSADGRFTIVFNGEIYNYIELRRELQKLGCTFRSSGDTEVLLAAYVVWGKECLPKLNGMWAFLIYDSHRRTVFGSRDRFGVKPLYRYQDSEQMIIASEIKGILASGSYSRKTNWQVAANFLIRNRLETTDDTFFENIVKVPSGTAFEIDAKGAYREWRYWSLSALPKVDVREPAKEFAELFESAVQLRMRSDVAVGVSLSGGLDSTSIICAMSRLREASVTDFNEPLFAFSYATEEFDESRYVTDTLRQTQAELVMLETDATTLLDKLDQVLWYHDEPVHSMTALIGYELMRLAARSGVKVVLGGQGADETVAGYPSYFADYWLTLASQAGLQSLRDDISAHSLVHNENPTRLLRNALLRVLRSKLRRFGPYQALRSWNKAKNPERYSWFTNDFLHNLPSHTEHSELGLDAALKFSIERENLPVYLRVEDRNSMAHSVEMRLPFLDYRLVSYLFHLPANWKMREGWNKYVLREAMRRKIPESVRRRSDKMGFPVPHNRWLDTSLRGSLLELLDTRSMRERGIYDLAAIRRDLASSTPRYAGMAGQAFDLIQFESWFGLSNPVSEHVDQYA
jgi:asparagine synthase (glutamine-hydrolysing)